MLAGATSREQRLDRAHRPSVPRSRGAPRSRRSPKAKARQPDPWKRKAEAWQPDSGKRKAEEQWPNPRKRKAEVWRADPWNPGWGSVDPRVEGAH
jgi:hypothetical protein